MATQVETQNKDDMQTQEIIPLRYSLAGPAVTNDTIIGWYKPQYDDWIQTTLW